MRCQPEPKSAKETEGVLAAAGSASRKRITFTVVYFIQIRPENDTTIDAPQKRDRPYITAQRISSMGGHCIRPGTFVPRW